MPRPQPAAAGAPIQWRDKQEEQYPCVLYPLGQDAATERGDDCKFEHVEKGDNSRPASTVHSIRFVELSANNYVDVKCTGIDDLS